MYVIYIYMCVCVYKLVEFSWVAKLSSLPTFANKYTELKMKNETVCLRLSKFDLFQNPLEVLPTCS